MPLSMLQSCISSESRVEGILMDATKSLSYDDTTKRGQWMSYPLLIKDEHDFLAWNYEPPLAAL